MRLLGALWLESPIQCEGRIVRPPLNSSQLNDSELPEICVRMHLIFDSIEFERAEGRLMNVSIFDSIDSLHSDLVNRLEDWKDSIAKFGEHYGLRPHIPIKVTSRAVQNIRRMADQFGIEIPYHSD